MLTRTWLRVHKLRVRRFRPVHLRILAGRPRLSYKGVKLRPKSNPEKKEED